MPGREKQARANFALIFNMHFNIDLATGRAINGIIPCNYSINVATGRAINKDNWPRPRTINSPRRSRGLLIVRGRGQLSFNPTTTRRINVATGANAILRRFGNLVNHSTGGAINCSRAATSNQAVGLVTL